MSTSQTPPSTQKVWFITGTSSGFGFHLVNTTLERGDLVIATARDTSKIDNAFPRSERLKILRLDVTDSFETIKEVVKEAISVWGRVDVLVNNAGYGVLGLIEEIGPEGFKTQYDINLWGVIHVTLAFMPYLRQARSGTIVQIGSRLAWVAESPGDALYASSKAAVHAFSESLAAELAPFNIKILIYQPGGFLTTNTATTPFFTDNPIPDYDAMRDAAVTKRKETPKKFIGDPQKCMVFLADLVRGEGKAEGKELPRYLVCGPYANESVLRKCKIMEDVVKEWEWATKEMIMDGVEYLG